MKQFFNIGVGQETLELAKKLAKNEDLTIYATIKKSLELLVENQLIRQKIRGIKVIQRVSSKRAFWEWMRPNLPENEVKWYTLHPELLGKDMQNYGNEYQEFKISYLQAQKQDAKIQRKYYHKDYYKKRRDKK